MSEIKQIPIRFRLLNGDIIVIDIEQEILKSANRDYHMKDVIESKSKDIIGTQLRSYRIHVTPNEDDENKYFDYIVLIDPRHLDCVTKHTNNIIDIRLESLYHILDLMDELDENKHFQQELETEYLSFHYDIDCWIKDGIIDELCKRLNRLNPTILKWNTVSSKSDSQYQYIDDEPLSRFKTIKHLIIESKMTEEIIRYIQHRMTTVEELTFFFEFDHFRQKYPDWGKSLANTNIHTLTIRSPINSRDDDQFHRFKQKLWPQWEKNTEKTDIHQLTLNKI